MTTFADKKAEQIEKLKILAEKNRGTSGSTRDLPRHVLTSLELYFDSFKYVGRQGSIAGSYYRWCVTQLAAGKRINFGALTRKIIEENPGIVYVR